MVPVELRRRCGLDFTAPGKSFEEKVAELASAIRGEVAEPKGPAVTLDFYYQEHLPIANMIILEIASGLPSLMEAGVRTEWSAPVTGTDWLRFDPRHWGMPGRIFWDGPR